MLLRIRDEITLTLATYECLYQSAIAFGIRKMLSIENREIEAEQKLKDLEENKSELEKKVMVNPLYEPSRYWSYFSYCNWKAL